MRAFLGWVVAGVVAIGLTLVLMHVFIAPVNPQQRPPGSHPTSKCWLCHVVSPSISIRETP